MDQFTNMFVIFNAAIGVFALYSAITGQGAAFKNDYPEKVKGPANALLRKFLWAIGPVLLLSAASDYFKIFGDATMIVSYICIGIVLALIIAYVVLFRIRFGKDLK